MSNNQIENFSSKKENTNPNKEEQNPSNLTGQESQNNQNQKLFSEKEYQEKKDKSISSKKLKITEHYEIKSKQNLEEKDKEKEDISQKEEANKFEKDKKYFINDYYSEESEMNSPKIIEGKTAIDINEIIGDETKQPISLDMIDDPNIPLSPGKISAKSFGVISSYAANTNQGIVRDYNEDRVSVIINMNKPKYYIQPTPWPKISYFGVFDGHAGNQCAEFLRDNLLNYICDNNFFPNDVPNAIKYGFKKIDEDYLKKYAFINNKLIDNSGSCGLILLLVYNTVYIANVGDSRCLGSFQNGKLQKDITLDHKPNTPYEKERIIKNGGKIYQTQTPIEDDESFKDKILIGPYRVSPGKLSVSRTVGDAEGKIEALGGNPNVIVPIPDIFSFDLEKDDVDFFILGCDGIYDQLYSKDVFKCAWIVLNNNLDLFKKNIFDNNVENNFKGNYGDKINMNTTSGNIVDLILKASMIRKSFDNVTCLFISFKNFFENIENTIPAVTIGNEKTNTNANSNINTNNKIEKSNNKSKEILLRNKSNLHSESISNKLEPKIIFREKNKSVNNLTVDTKISLNNLNNNKLLKDIKREKENEYNNKEKDKNKDEDISNKNNLNIRKVNNISANKRKIRINSLPKQPLITNIQKKNVDENISNLSHTNQNNMNKNMTVNNIITYNNNIYLNNENRKQTNSFQENMLNKNNNINIINSPLAKDKNNNALNNSSNQLFFTKMHITGINIKKNKTNLNKNNLNKNIINNKEDNYRHTSYNKKIKPLFTDNSNDMGLMVNTSKKEKIYLGSPNNINKNKNINYKKISEEQYNQNYGNTNNNLRSNSHSNNDLKNFNIKPIILKNDKFQQGNIFNLYQKNHNIKFNNIIKNNNYALMNKKYNNMNNINNLTENNNNNNIVSLKNITLTKLKKPKRNDEVKIKKPMPTLGHLQIDKYNKFNEENNFVKQRRFITNDNVKRKSNLSEHKQINSNGSYKVELNLSNKNNTGIGNKINNLYNRNGDVNKIKFI